MNRKKNHAKIQFGIVYEMNTRKNGMPKTPIE